MLETRSFVPIERNSASSAISVGATHALGRLDHRSELESVLLAERVPQQRPHGANLLRRLDER